MCYNKASVITKNGTTRRVRQRNKEGIPRDAIQFILVSGCYGAVSNEQVEERIKMRAEQFPCDNVVVYCIGCVRAMISGGKIPRYLPDLLLDRAGESMPDTLDEYHSRLEAYIQKH